MLELAKKLVEERIPWTRKWSDEPAFLHSIRVGEMLRDFGFSEDVVIGWILHDIIEDWDTSFEELKSFWFNDRIIELVDFATHDEKITPWLLRRNAMMQRIINKRDLEIRALKVADISDNLTQVQSLPHIDSLQKFMNIKVPLFITQSHEFLWDHDLYKLLLSRYDEQFKLMNKRIYWIELG
jgi:(p)ppGpp synthase/HD superfamily hydrolase